jgi:hypothetical protein
VVVERPNPNKSAKPAGLVGPLSGCVEEPQSLHPVLVGPRSGDEDVPQKPPLVGDEDPHCLATSR